MTSSDDICAFCALSDGAEQAADIMCLFLVPSA